MYIVSSTSLLLVTYQTWKRFSKREKNTGLDLWKNVQSSEVGKKHVNFPKFLSKNL